MEVDPFYSAHLSGPNPAFFSQANLLPTQAHTLHLSHPFNPPSGNIQPYPSTPHSNPPNPSTRLPHSSTQEEFISSPEEEICCSTPGLVSSNSSQSSSGYSTAPSEQYYTHGGHFRSGGGLKTDILRSSEPSPSPFHNLQLTKDQVFAISQSFESGGQSKLLHQDMFGGLSRAPAGGLSRAPAGGSKRKTRERGAGNQGQELPLLSLQDTHLI